MAGRIAAGNIKLACEAIERAYAIAPTELLDAAGLQEQDLRDPGVLLSADAMQDVLRFALERTQDPGMGLRLARALDLRMQGFWGYALLSSLTLRERIDIHI